MTQALILLMVVVSPAFLAFQAYRRGLGWWRTTQALGGAVLYSMAIFVVLGLIAFKLTGLPMEIVADRYGGPLALLATLSFWYWALTLKQT